MAALLTIGVYGFDRESFLGTLAEADVRLLVDVRQRRAVRGSEYAWANSQRLQDSLAEAGIDYRHRLDLAPTTEMRQLQYAEDDRRGVGKRSRHELAPAFAERYTAEVLDHADLADLVATLPTEGSAVLLCVEAEPSACHRSLIAERLRTEHGLEVGHLTPRPATPAP